MLVLGSNELVQLLSIFRSRRLLLISLLIAYLGRSCVFDPQEILLELKILHLEVFLVI